LSSNIFLLAKDDLLDGKAFWKYFLYYLFFTSSKFYFLN